MRRHVLLPLALFFSAPAFAGVPPKVLITSFDPFGGSAANQSQAIASEIRARARELGWNVDIRLCNLPVVYDLAADIAGVCIEQVRPAVVLSLGEAGCSLRLESAATNWDASGADNSGESRNGSEIVPGAAKRVGFSFPVPAMYCGLSREEGERVQVSASPGSFVCNNVAYHLASRLAGRAPFVFVHVPNSRCSEDARSPETNARWIVSMMKSAMETLETDVSSVTMPTDVQGAGEMLLRMIARRAPACEIRFAERLRQAYD